MRRHGVLRGEVADALLQRMQRGLGWRKAGAFQEEWCLAVSLAGFFVERGDFDDRANHLEG